MSNSKIRSRFEDGWPKEAKIAAALTRVGVLQTDRLDWALKFCQVDFSRWSIEELQKLRLQLAIFTTIAPEPDHGRGSQRRALDRFGIGGEGCYWPLPTLDTLRKVQRAGCSLLQDLHGRGQVRLGPFKMQTTLHRPPYLSRWRKRDVEVFSADSAEDFYCRDEIQGYDELRPEYLLVFPYQLSHLIARFAGHVARCKDVACGKWFVGQRVTREFCTPACRSRIAMREHRARYARRQMPHA